MVNLFIIQDFKSKGKMAAGTVINYPQCIPK